MPVNCSVRLITSPHNARHFGVTQKYKASPIMWELTINNRAYFLPDATTVLAHNVFSMLRLSWMGGSLSSCSGRKKENNTKLPIFITHTSDTYSVKSKSIRWIQLTRSEKALQRQMEKQGNWDRILRRWQSRKHEEFLPTWTTATGHNLPDTTTCFGALKSVDGLPGKFWLIWVHFRS